MSAAPPLQEVDLTGAKTNKGRFWWELRKRRALSQQAGFIEMQMARPRPRRATSRPLTSQPPRRAGLNGPIDAPAVPAARWPGGPGASAAAGAARPPKRSGLASFCHRFHFCTSASHPRQHRRPPPRTQQGVRSLARRFARLPTKEQKNSRRCCVSSKRQKFQSSTGVVTFPPNPRKDLLT